jgi:hypothetical protein
MLHEDTVANMPLPPVQRSVVVPLERAAAFDLFVRRIGEWWPLLTHSCANEEAESCRIETGVGGRIVERTKAGVEHEWGTVLEWEEPRLVRFTWHPAVPKAQATEVLVTFEHEDEGTRVVLVHRDWERFGSDAASVRGRYERGWGLVLEEYVARANLSGQTTKSSS